MLAEWIFGVKNEKNTWINIQKYWQNGYLELKMKYLYKHTKMMFGNENRNWPGKKKMEREVPHQAPS